MRSIAGFLFGIFLALVLTALLGEQPLHVASVLIRSAVGTPYDLGQTLYYSTTLMFTGLAVLIAFQSGLFNIGVDGQLTLACLAVAVAPLLFGNLSGLFGSIVLFFLAGITAMVWAALPALLHVFRNSHEVVTSMMMNFVAYGVAAFVTLNLFKSTQSQNPETEAISQSLMLQRAPFQEMADSYVNTSFVLALAACVVVYVFLHRTKWGYFLRATGIQPQAASYAGISQKFAKILGFLMSGFLGGLAALNEVTGAHGKFILGISGEMGFVAIGVAMAAQNHPLKIIPASFLFAFLIKGSSDLELETQTITRDFAKILQGVILLSVIAFQTEFFPKIIQRFKNRARAWK